MSVLTTWSDILEQAGQGSATFLKDVGTKVSLGYCHVWAKYPNLLRLHPFSRGFINAMCSGIGGEVPPPPEDPGFTGGQCCDVLYTIRIDFTANSSTNPVPSFTILSPIPGAINAVSLEQGTAPGTTQYLYWIVKVTRCNGQSEQVDPVLAGSIYADIVITAITITRNDGLPDDCGDPPVSYPPDPSFDQSDFIFDIDVDIRNEIGDIVSTETLNVDLGWDIVNDFNLNLSFPITVVVGNANFTLDFGGINITNNRRGGGSSSDPDIRKYGFDPEDYKEIPEPPEEEEQEGQDETIEWVLITVTTLPTKGKTIVHSDPANNDYFAGYLNWLYEAPGGTFYGESIPIRKQKMIFRAPDGSVGYRAYAVNGAKIRAKSYLQKVPPRE